MIVLASTCVIALVAMLVHYRLRTATPGRAPWLVVSLYRMARFAYCVAVAVDRGYAEYRRQIDGCRIEPVCGSVAGEGICVRT